MRFVKGHGTENDFVILPDGAAGLEPDLVRRLCDRRAGIGADGVLAVVERGDGYFMDYRNADGSHAETCGNGIRVFARYLVSTGRAPAGTWQIDTRSGPRTVTVPGDGGDITVDMGTPQPLSPAQVTVGERSWKALGWSMGNPHLVVLDAGPLDALDLTVPPLVEPDSAYPDGVNVELVEPIAPRALRMRVHERGVGETRSCGTGACAVAVAAMDVAGERATYEVAVPGGRLVVSWEADGRVLMAGPAVLAAHGEVDLDALR